MLSALRTLLISTTWAKRVDLGGKKIIVTGAAPGSIGYETAKTLTSWGATVIITTRSSPQAVARKMLAELSGNGRQGTIDAHPLDLCRTASVKRFADWYTVTHGQRLDVLINNAGIHLDLLSQWQAPQLSDDGFEIQWRTNYLGTAHLTHLLLPLLRNSGRAGGDARIVNVVSQLHSKGSNAGLFEPLRPYNSWTAYGMSKLALVHTTFEAQRRYAVNAYVQAYCLHPGAVYTNIANKGLAGNPLIEGLRKTMAPIEAFFLLTPEEGAQTQIHCATSPGLAGGIYYRQCRAANASMDAQDAQISARLWNDTEAWVKALAESNETSIPD